MRGGKREGAGRKGYGPSKAYWLPIALEPEIKALMEKYKAEHNKSKAEKPSFDSLSKSKEPIKPKVPILSKEQLKRLQEWLVKSGYVKSKTEARKLTASPKLYKETVIKYASLEGEPFYNEFSDIADLYIV